MDPARLTAWSYRRQRLDGSVDGAEEALRDVIGVYSAHPAGPLALHARTAGLDAVTLRRLEEERRAVRVVAMRGSAFLVPTDTASRIVAATRPPGGIRDGDLRARGLDRETYQRLRPRIVAATTTPVTPAELRRALGADEGDELPYFAMRLMAREGQVLRVGTGRIRTDDLRWVATEAWLGRPLGEEDPDSALAWLAGAYLRAFGPARPADLAWWAGITQARASRALAACRTVSLREPLAGLVLPEDLVDAWAGTEPLDPEMVTVLGKWDPYAMGHAPDGRSRWLDDVDRPLAFTTAASRVGATTGDALPVILRGGRAVATWSHRLDGDRMEVEVRPFPGRGPVDHLLAAAAPAFEAIGRFLGASVTLRAESR